MDWIPDWYAKKTAKREEPAIKSGDHVMYSSEDLKNSTLYCPACGSQGSMFTGLDHKPTCQYNPSHTANACDESWEKNR